MLNLFLNPQTKLLRSGWRVLAFLLIAALPRVAAMLVTTPGGSADTDSVIEVSGAMVAVYVALILWFALVSWFCLHFLERLRFAALGCALHRGWSRDLLAGLAISALMMAAVVALQMLGGGTRLHWNAQMSVRGLALATLLLLVAAAFEEVLFRGYAFQTLLRDVPAFVPIALLSLIFGMAHWSNPSRTLFSTLNTVLAGVWLGVAYLKTRSLWLATGLHFGWNWTMGLGFGIPVSGMPLHNALFTATSGAPLWLTGSTYGSEGGAAATLILILATLYLWRAPWLRISPEMLAATTRTASAPEAPLKLGLDESA